MSNPIALAVEPLRQHAIDGAVKFFYEKIEELRIKLAAHGGVLYRAAPYPDSYQTKGEYMAQLAWYSFVHRVCSQTGEHNQEIQRWCDARNALYIVNSNLVEAEKLKTIEFAEAQYLAFVEKLTKKIGPVSSAVLEGDGVWEYSFLRVVTEAGESQTWKTQMIWNTSSLGRRFPQWPTRKVKNK